MNLEEKLDRVIQRHNDLGAALAHAGELDEAIAIASRIPAAGKGTVEIRPVFELSGLPESK